MEPLSVSETARRAKVSRQAVSIALTDGRLTAVTVIGQRAVKVDGKYRKFLKGTRNRKNGNGKAKTKK